MKKLYLLRHAKASWNDDNVEDKDRIISYLGINEAKKVAAEIINKNIKFDKILSSPAKRAYQTAEIIKNKTGFSGEIIFEESFYFDYQKEILRIIKILTTRLTASCWSVIIPHGQSWSQTLLTRGFISIPQTLPP